jgi:hypothetical protein
MDRGLFYWPNLSGETQLSKKEEEEEELTTQDHSYFSIYIEREDLH